MENELFTLNDTGKAIWDNKLDGRRSLAGVVAARGGVGPAPLRSRRCAPRNSDAFWPP
ncbi:MAG: PqqD family protein [Actinomycetes bacterium]